MDLDGFMSDRKKSVPELCSRNGAHELKERIEAYWRERGYDVTVDTVQSGFTGVMRSVRYDVRSAMRNGMPTKKTA